MWGYLGLGALELLLIRTPSIIIELSAKGSLWAACSIYEWYSPTISETRQLQIELERIKFEMEELRNPEWIIVEKP